MEVNNTSIITSELANQHTRRAEQRLISPWSLMDFHGLPVLRNLIKFYQIPCIFLGSFEYQRWNCIRKDKTFMNICVVNSI